MSVLTQAPVNLNTTNWTAITVQSSLCTAIRVCETDQAGTTDYLMAAPTSTDGPKTIPAGKLAAAAKKPGKVGQRARLAQTRKSFKKRG